MKRINRIIISFVIGILNGVKTYFFPSVRFYNGISGRTEDIMVGIFLGWLISFLAISAFDSGLKNGLWKPKEKKEEKK